MVTETLPLDHCARVGETGLGDRNRTHIHFTQIVTIGNGNVSGNTLLGRVRTGYPGKSIYLSI